MSLAAVMDELATVLDAITGLRVHPHPVEKISAPAGVVSYPEEINYLVETGDGTVRYERVPVWLLVGKATSKGARDAVSAYVDIAGERSVKANLEGHAWTTCDFVVARRATFDTISIAGVDYLAAQFELDVVAS